MLILIDTRDITKDTPAYTWSLFAIKILAFCGCGGLGISSICLLHTSIASRVPFSVCILSLFLLSRFSNTSPNRLYILSEPFPAL